MVLDRGGDDKEPPKTPGHQYTWLHSRRLAAHIVYWLYLASFPFLLPGIVGVMIAYANRNDGPTWLRSHHVFQIKTFWRGLAIAAAGAAAGSFFGIGYVILMLDFLWVVGRAMCGLFWLSKKFAVPHPRGWGFGN